VRDKNKGERKKRKNKGKNKKNKKKRKEKKKCGCRGFFNYFVLPRHFFSIPCQFSVCHVGLKLTELTPGVKLITA
jgi:hypothetical protein